MNELQEEIKNLKHLQETPVENTILNTRQTSTSKSKDISKKREYGLCTKQRPTRKHQPFHSNHLYKTNHANFNKLRRTIEDSIGLQSDPAGHVINLSKKNFTKDVYKLLNKKLNFVSTQKTFDKKTQKTFDKEVNDFYRRIKLKAHFKDTASHQHLTEDEIFKKRSIKSWIPPKNHLTVETIIEAANKDIDAVIKKLKGPKYSNLSEREQKALEELKVRDDIVITNVDKGAAAVILDAKDYIEECEGQLNNTENCKRLQNNPAATNNELVHSVRKRLENEKLIQKNIPE